MAQRTKKPHFVPAAYLQFWDSGDDPEGRESKIWWCDGKVSKLQRVGNIAVQTDFYSVRNPDAAETYLGEFEVDWVNLVRQLAAGKPPKADILASLLLLQASYFLLRNPKFRNNDAVERFDVYKTAVEVFWRQVLMAGHVPNHIEDAAEQMLKVWNCNLLRAQGGSWITSDNPVLLLSCTETTPAIIFLPITPSWALLALRTNMVKLVSKKITVQDTEYLNSYTAINSIRHIYSNRPFDRTEMLSFSKWVAKRSKTDNWITVSEIHIEPFKYPVHGMKLGFL